MSNLLCTASFLPVLLGVLPHPVARRLLTEPALVGSMFFAAAAVTLLGVAAQWDHARGPAANFAHGAWFAWAGNGRRLRPAPRAPLPSSRARSQADSRRPPPPPPALVLSGHAASFTPY